MTWNFRMFCQSFSTLRWRQSVINSSVIYVYMHAHSSTRVRNNGVYDAFEAFTLYLLTKYFRSRKIRKQKCEHFLLTSEISLKRLSYNILSGEYFLWKYGVVVDVENWAESAAIAVRGHGRRVWFVKPLAYPTAHVLFIKTILMRPVCDYLIYTHKVCVYILIATPPRSIFGINSGRPASTSVARFRCLKSSLMKKSNLVRLSRDPLRKSDVVQSSTRL